VPGLLDLHTDDAVLESPLVPRILDQVDIAEVMELANGRIAAHRVYWGWFGAEMLIANALQRASTSASQRDRVRSATGRRHL
jgi:hypothetical protein